MMPRYWNSNTKQWYESEKPADGAGGGEDISKTIPGTDLDPKDLEGMSPVDRQKYIEAKRKQKEQEQKKKEQQQPPKPTSTPMPDQSPLASRARTNAQQKTALKAASK